MIHKMMMRLLLGFLFLFEFCFFSCKEKESPAPSGEFFKIVNDKAIDNAYKAIDIVQTPDDGFLILAIVDKWNTHLIKTDNSGNLLWEKSLEQSFVNPLPALFFNNDKYQFFCMDAETSATYIMEVNEEAGTASVVKTFDQITYPLSASYSAENGILLQYFNSSSAKTGIAHLMEDFSISWSREYEVTQNIRNYITGHVTGEGTKLPFFTGSMEDGPLKFFFNGFFDSGFSLVFVEPYMGEPVGLVVGNNDGPGINAIRHITLNKFSVARTNQNVQFFQPHIEINPNSLVSSGELQGNSISGLAPNGNTRIHQFPVQRINKLIFASEAENGQVVLHAYDQISGTLQGVKYIGGANRFEIGSVIGTNDGGIAMVTTCYIIGRVPRIAIIKLAENEVNAFIAGK